MREYDLQYAAKFDKQMSKLNRHSAARIQNWLDENLYLCTNPRAHGKPLVGALHGLWSYRVGVYRILARIDDGELLILCITVEHRRSVYR